MILKIPVRYEGANGEKVLYTLFDSGATFSCINPEHVADIAEPNKMRTPLDVATASTGTYLKINERIVPDFYINDVRMSDEFMVVPNLGEDAITGVTTMQKMAY
jgi:predicted aspartyl protease